MPGHLGKVRVKTAGFKPETTQNVPSSISGQKQDASISYNQKLHLHRFSSTPSPSSLLHTLQCSTNQEQPNISTTKGNRLPRLIRVRTIPHIRRFIHGSLSFPHAWQQQTHALLSQPCDDDDAAARFEGLLFLARDLDWVN
ncbi:hypothetical protein LIA77_05244 [Sarocladium implicatum]|nr:hypothetical protein LIA77_05244 [Sarocladium implicatum]